MKVTAEVSPDSILGAVNRALNFMEAIGDHFKSGCEGVPKLEKRDTGQTQGYSFVCDTCNKSFYVELI